MAPLPVDEGLVYRKGNFTVRAFTPRPNVDTVGQPGKMPGLSTWWPFPLEAKDKVQVIDLTKLRDPLQAFEDDVDLAGGEEGHVSIVPVNENGEVDETLLDDWAAARSTDALHPLTRIVLDGVVYRNVRRQP